MESGPSARMAAMPSSKSSTRRIRHEQEPLIVELEARHQGIGLRFESGFHGFVPVQANGRIGRRYFYFRFRQDCASLTVGHPDLRGMAGRDRRNRYKHRRAMRRGRYERWSFDYRIALMNLNTRRDSVLARHPSNEVAYASVSGVAGDPYAGTLAPEEAAVLFERLLAGLKPVDPRIRSFRNGRKVFKRSSTVPMAEHGVVIVKPSKRRR